VILFVLAGILPVLFWPGTNMDAPLLRQAGITHLAVPAARAPAWKTVTGIEVEAVDLNHAVRVPAPGVNYRMSDASASRVPWVNSNGWRFLRQPKALFCYEVKGVTAALAAAEAFSFGATAIIQTDATGLAPLASMLKFLGSLDVPQASALADFGFVDDGSALDAEVMNLLVRDNLFFKVVRTPDPRLELTVQLGSNEYSSNDVNVLEHRIRANLNDERRLIRIYGTSVVVARPAVDDTSRKLCIHLLNYGAARGTRVGAFRIHLIGRYGKGNLHAPDTVNSHLMDYESGPDATEFTVPELKTYAAVDLTTTQQ
jgi:hypothetical protein